MPFLRKVTSVPDEDLADEIPVLVEPKPGFSDEDVAESLRACGSVAVTILAPGFVSARAQPRALRQVAEIAWVHLKREKQPRSA
jgi:hypothetical protein